MSLCNPLGTEGRLGVHNTFRNRSMTTYGRLVCFQNTYCIVGVTDFIFKLFLSFFVKS